MAKRLMARMMGMFRSRTQVGVDRAGNNYFSLVEEVDGAMKEKRWVEFKGDRDPTTVPGSSCTRFQQEQAHTRTKRDKIKLTRSGSGTTEQAAVFNHQQHAAGDEELDRTSHQKSQLEQQRWKAASATRRKHQDLHDEGTSASNCHLAAIAVSRRRRKRQLHPASTAPTAATVEEGRTACKLPNGLSKSKAIHRSGGRRTPKARTGAATTATGSREGTPRLRRAAAAPATADLPWSSAGAPRAEEGTAAARNLSDHAAVSSASPAGHPRTPRLCTRRDPSIPRPPAAGAAAEARNRTDLRRRAVEWICWLNGQRKKAPTPEELTELEARRERVRQNVELLKKKEEEERKAGVRLVKKIGKTESPNLRSFTQQFPGTTVDQKKGPESKPNGRTDTEDGTTDTDRSSEPTGTGASFKPGTWLPPS